MSDDDALAAEIRDAIRAYRDAAIAAEREACARMLDEAAREARTARDNFRVLHETTHADRHDNRASAYAAGANAIRARGTT